MTEDETFEPEMDLEDEADWLGPTPNMDTPDVLVPGDPKREPETDP